MVTAMKSNAGVSIVCGLALLASGCGTTEVAQRRDPYAAVEFAGARQVYEPDRIAPKQMPLQTVGEGADRVVLAPESYAGIVGSREAHRRYPQDVAERLDGQCEGSVRVADGESLADISDYCDVPMRALASHNAGVGNTYLVGEGVFVRVPGANDVAQNAVGLGAAGALLGEITASADDTVETVAYRYNVSTNAVKELNPQLQWRDVLAGEALQVPLPSTQSFGGNAVPANPSLAASNSSSSAGGQTANAPSAWQGYAVETTDSGGAGNGIVDSHMPYALAPTDDPSRAASRDADVRLVANKSLVRQGGQVTLSLSGVPAGTDVTFYQGKNISDMKTPKTVRVGRDGVASNSFMVSKKKSDMGGYVFMATRADTGETYYSERVGVMKIQDPADLEGGSE
ncbi:MAG: LysM peptidoglycan-binding domain-containing protein [Pseudomonadota bacterium]